MAPASVFSGSQSDPGFEFERFSVSPFSEGPHSSGGVRLEGSPHPLARRQQQAVNGRHALARPQSPPAGSMLVERPLPQEDDGGTLGVKPRGLSLHPKERDGATPPITRPLGPLPNNGDGDDSPVTNPYATATDADIPDYSLSQQHVTGRAPEDPFVQGAENDRQYPSNLGYLAPPYAEYGTNIAENTYVPGSGGSHIAQVNMTSQMNGNMNMNCVLNGHSMRANNMNMGSQMGMSNDPNGNFSMQHVPAANFNDIGHGTYGDWHKMHHGPTEGPSSMGVHHDAFGNFNNEQVSHAANNHFDTEQFSQFAMSNPMAAPGLPIGGPMHGPYAPMAHGVPGTDVSLAVNRWQAEAATTYGHYRGYQDPVTLRAHMAPNPLEMARKELESVNQRLYRVTQELERAVQTFRTHLDESDSEAQRMSQMVGRLGDTSQLPAIRRGLEMLAGDLRERVRRGRAVTFVNETTGGTANGRHHGARLQSEHSGRLPRRR